MKLLVLDGNSIVNRAFYGIRQLNAKNGLNTNAIYGFMNILLKLREQTEPDAIAIAFDLRAPTFRHKMYDKYKAGRKGMPPELAEQMPVLKELLSALGYKIVEKEGYEADDILGTLSHACLESGDFCYIATGDRDSLQLVNENCNVILATTKAGQAHSDFYDIEAVKEKYGVEPIKLIDIKAIQGDSSDNIPGVAGIGEKGARDLISRFGSVKNIYEHIDSLDIKDSIRKKLLASKDMAFLSRELGEICLCVPIDTNIDSYKIGACDREKSIKILRELELFSIMKRLSFEATEPIAGEMSEYRVEYAETEDLFDLCRKIEFEGKAYFSVKADNENIGIAVLAEDKVFFVQSDNFAFYDFLKTFFESGLAKYTDNSKPAYALADEYGIELKNVVMDCALAGYLLNPSANDYSAIRLAQEYGVTVPVIEGAGENLITAESASVLRILSEKLSVLIEQNNQKALLSDIEIPLAEVLASMESVGFDVNEAGIKEFGETIGLRIDNITSEIYGMIGRKINLNSPKQLGAALFEDLGLPCKKKTKSGYSTKADVLESLTDKHPVIPLILEYRTLSKLKSTYCDGLLKVIAPDGRIHSSFNQLETRTGRISSTEPNLQNIPVRTELGAELRKFFIAKNGYLLVDADYSQIELRVLAAVADDEKMIEAFNSGEDIHSTTASQVFNTPIEDVTHEMRSRAKAVNFGIVYGIGAFSLGKDIGVPYAQADSYIKGYLMHYNGVADYMKSIVKKAKENGYASTLFGRRRYLPELNSSNGKLRSFGERVAKNMPIQGTAADIIKIAMVRVYRRLKAEKLKSRLILQVHDELIIEAPESEADYVKKLLKEEMENACTMKVSLLAEVNAGKTWYEAKG